MEKGGGILFFEDMMMSLIKLDNPSIPTSEITISIYS